MESPPAPVPMARIKALDPSVVNKIAAGEIIIAPANALKEILENAIDAGATSIEVVVKEGGLKLLQITDNGHGIHPDDLPILCERYTTSKLSTFTDLSTIQTYGFRGEALASISHISHLSVVTKKPDSAVAYKAVYLNGALAPAKKGGNPQPLAGRNGTQIIVEDLFYNVPSRLRATRSSADEYYKILEVVQKYTVHCLQAGFMVKKVGESSYVLLVRQGLSTKERIRTLYGSGVANNLLELEDVLGEPRYGLRRFHAWFTSPSYTSTKKQTPPVFFINHRLVSCDPLRKALQRVFAPFLPKGANHPFIYLAMEVAPENLDVNVHPTKREVRFLHEEEVVELIADRVHQMLLENDGTRVFQTQTLRAPAPTQRDPEPPRVGSQVKRPRQESKLVRIDASQTKISTFLTSTQLDSQSTGASDESQEAALHSQSLSGGTPPPASQPAASSLRVTYTTDRKRHRTKIRLTSLAVLKSAVEVTAHETLTGVLQNCLFIGVVDAHKRLCVFQEDLRLYMCDYGALCYQLFYQTALAEFGNYGTITLALDSGEGISVADLLRPLGGDVETLASQLVGMKEMFKEYFSLSLETHNGTLKLLSLPLLMRNYNPPMAKVGLLLLRLCTKVDYTTEQACFEGILRQLALFYIPEMGPVEPLEAFQLQTHAVLEDVIFPALKAGFLAPKSMLRDVVEIANLPGLYKVFERC